MQDKRHQVDMINGPIAGPMIAYALPILITSVLQLLYNAADVAVVGKFAGKEALAAVGSTTSLIHLLVNFFVGLFLGAVLYLFSGPVLSLYTSDPVVLAYGQRRMATLFWCFFLCGLQQVTVGMLRGMGRSFIPMLVSIGGICGVRLLWIYLITAIGLLNPAVTDSVVWIYYSYPITWLITYVVHFICYVVVKKKTINTFQIEDEKTKNVES